MEPSGTGPGGNPDALQGAPRPRVDLHQVAGTSLYAEVRGSGPALLLIGAADEDAEVYRSIAERLSDRFTVVTYDRRGTRRSGREAWPGGGSARHADDAAALLADLGLDDAAALGASAGGIVALQLALRHPGSITTALCFEPGFFHLVPGGAEFRQHAQAAVDRYLASHPGRWAGASAVLGRAVVESLTTNSRGLFTPPEGREWYAERCDSNAEALIRGDLALTSEVVDEEAVASCPVDLRFAYGTRSLPIFRDITTRLAALRGANPDPLPGSGHGLFYHPEAAVAYVRHCLE